MASITWLKHTMFDVYRSQSVRRSFRHPENNVSVTFAMVTSLKSSLFSVHGPVHSPVHGPVHESRVQVLYHPAHSCQVAPVDFKMYHKIDLTQSSINKVIDEYNYLAC